MNQAVCSPAARGAAPATQVARPFERSSFLREFNSTGSAIVANVLDRAFIERARRELSAAQEGEVRYHGTKEYAGYGMVLLCARYGGAFFDLFDNPRLTEPFEAALGEGCIVYAYTSSSMPPGGGNYSTRIHTDCPRIIPGYVTNVGATILLDDFTAENGATWYLPGSQSQAEPPSDETFRERAARLIAPAGSVWYFNARLWHAGGKNQTNGWRHALTISMCRPWMKQRIDIPRALADVDLSGCSQKVLQKLGFFAQCPASYDEYYQPPERRKWRQKTE